MPKGKVIVITGAASGLGEAWVKGFLNDGAIVIAADINEQNLEAIAEMGAFTFKADVAVEADVKSMIDFAVDKTGQIDVLFNNAGIGINRPFLDVQEKVVPIGTMKRRTRCSRARDEPLHHGILRTAELVDALPPSTRQYSTKSASEKTPWKLLTYQPANRSSRRKSPSDTSCKGIFA